ncbi:YbbR-like domain-containing protein [Deinococcus sp. Marseille-Q6407]|uniref:CdaR family protein n=1 Tax=Deinococcus sp. Marseille-Q6407 TaxID=2969223 RepID=UPI0021C1A6D9|nr:CdaR family protein [Deinococcus sp. Marseille-Q6407]
MTAPGSVPPPAPGSPPNRQQARESLRRSLTRDWGAKLLAFVAACVLWYAASEDRRAIIEQTYDVPVNVRDNTGEGAGEKRAVSGLSPSTIKVTLSGRPERLRELRGDRIEAVTDVTGLPEGTFNTAVTVAAPDNTTVVRTTPDRVQGLVDTVQTRTLPVTVTVYAPGSTLMPSYQVQPAEVTVSGPSRTVNEIEQLSYAPVNLEPGQSRTVNLLALNSAGQPVQDVTLSPATAELTRLDAGQPPARTLPVRLTAPPAGLQLVSSALSPAQVRVIGPGKTLDTLTEISGTPDYHAGTYQTEVRLLPPEGVQVLDRVTVKLQVRAAEAAEAASQTATSGTSTAPGGTATSGP